MGTTTGNIPQTAMGATTRASLQAPIGTGMRIGLIGDFSEPRDEGQKAIAHSLAMELARRRKNGNEKEITKLNIKAVSSRAFWTRVRYSDLQLVHYIPGPTIKSLALCKLVAAHHSAKIVVSAPQPTFSALSEKLVPALRPNLVLVQSRRWARWFKARGCATRFVPNGVDTDRFAPISTSRRRELRRHFGIDEDRFLILHVGHIIPRRNVQALADIQRSGKQVLMVASRFAKADVGLYSLLKGSGCRVIEGYVPDIEHIYAMADCYVFPTQPGNTILTPLSVLEAMACNVPVVSARFEGLLELFEEGNGLFFADTVADMVQAIEKVEAGGIDVRTREKVLPYSWSCIAEQIEQLYQSLLA